MNKQEKVITCLVLAMFMSIGEIQFLGFLYKTQIPILLVLSLFSNFVFIVGAYRLFSYAMSYRQLRPSILNTLSKPPYKETLKIISKQISSDGKFEGYVIDANGIALFAKSLVDIDLMNNITISNIYNYQISISTVVIDIGANIGYSALWFAKNHFVEKVFAYEPVLPNYEQALISFKLNPDLENKIELRNVGLSDRNCKTSIIYFRDHHTISSLLLDENNEKVKSEKPIRMDGIELVNACKIINGIIDFKEERNSQLLLKIDCEGSEYQIINVFDARIWDSINVILMEIHGNNYQELLNTLLEKGFSLFSINHQKHPIFDHLCDIYAIKNTAQDRNESNHSRN